MYLLLSLKNVGIMPTYIAFKLVIIGLTLMYSCY